MQHRVDVVRWMSFDDAEIERPGSLRRGHRMTEMLGKSIGVNYEMRRALIYREDGKEKLGFISVDAIAEAEGVYPLGQVLICSEALDTADLEESRLN